MGNNGLNILERVGGNFIEGATRFGGQHRPEDELK